jgi:CRISPR-associated protein Cmr5
MIRSLEQERAAGALAAVLSLPGDDAVKAGYRSYVDRLGPAIVMNGLGQALATEIAAAGSGSDSQTGNRGAHRLLYENLGGWLCRQGGGVYPGADDVLVALMDGDQNRYVRAQAEALAWLRWHKKFCHAELPEPARVVGNDEG